MMREYGSKVGVSSGYPEPKMNRPIDRPQHPKPRSLEDAFDEPEQCSRTETKYTLNDALCDSDNLIQELLSRMFRLQNKLESVLEQVPTCESNAVGPRVSSSPMMGRLNDQIHQLTVLNAYVEDLIGRIQL